MRHREGHRFNPGQRLYRTRPQRGVLRTRKISPVGEGGGLGAPSRRAALPHGVGDEDGAGHQEGGRGKGVALEVGVQVLVVLYEELLEHIRFVIGDVLVDDDGELLLELGKGELSDGLVRLRATCEGVVVRSCGQRLELLCELDVEQPPLGRSSGVQALVAPVVGAVDELVGARLVGCVEQDLRRLEVHVVVGHGLGEQPTEVAGERFGPGGLGLHRGVSSLESELENAITSSEHRQAFATKKPSMHEGFFVVGGEGFEPSKAQGQQIYSLSRLTASVSTRELWPQPTHLASVWQESWERCEYEVYLLVSRYECSP